MKRSILLYMRMSRPSQLVAVFLVYAWGSMVAGVLEGSSDTGSFLAGLAPLLLVSASIHYTNEYADHETDALTVLTPFSGGSGALSDYNARPILAFRAAWATLLVGLSLAIFLLLAGVLLPVALSILVIGAAGGWMYSLPPLALAWLGGAGQRPAGWRAAPRLWLHRPK
jgi:1,4-dihydroxy-2-naphthoate octaprenyltransferase